MQRSTLRRIAKEVWGNGWSWELARNLGRHPVTVRRWQAGLESMSLKDHLAAVEIMRAASEARHKTVLRALKNLKPPEKIRAKKYFGTKTIKRYRDPVPPWRKKPDGSLTPELKQRTPEF